MSIVCSLEKHALRRTKPCYQPANVNEFISTSVSVILSCDYRRRHESAEFQLVPQFDFTAIPVIGVLAQRVSKWLDALIVFRLHKQSKKSIKTNNVYTQSTSCSPWSNRPLSNRTRRSHSVQGTCGLIMKSIDLLKQPIRAHSGPLLSNKSLSACIIDTNGMCKWVITYSMIDRLEHEHYMSTMIDQATVTIQ